MLQLLLLLATITTATCYHSWRHWARCSRRQTGAATDCELAPRCCSLFLSASCRCSLILLFLAATASSFSLLVLHPLSILACPRIYGQVRCKITNRTADVHLSIYLLFHLTLIHIYFNFLSFIIKKLSISICIDINLSIYIYLSILSTYLHLSILSTYIYLSIYLSIYLRLSLSINLYLSI